MPDILLSVASCVATAKAQSADGATVDCNMTAQCRKEAGRWQRGLPGCARAHSGGRKTGESAGGAVVFVLQAGLCGTFGICFSTKN